MKQQFGSVEEHIDHVERSLSGEWDRVAGELLRARVCRDAVGGVVRFAASERPDGVV